MQKYKKKFAGIVCAITVGVMSTTALAQTYVDGVGAYKNGDYRKAFEVWSSLAAAGDREAQYSLGVLYEEGQGVAQDDRKALEWFLQSANNGHAEAQFNVGVAYWSGVGVDANRSKAIEYWEKAAERGLADAQYNLGVAYAEGYGVDKDLSKAIYWFGEAQKSNHPKAQPAAHFYSLELQEDQNDAQRAEIAASEAAAEQEKAQAEAAAAQQAAESETIVAEVVEENGVIEPQGNTVDAVDVTEVVEEQNGEATEVPIVVGGKVQPRENDTPMVVRPNTNLIFQTLNRGQTFEAIEISGNWVKVGGYDGVLGWVYGDFVNVQGTSGVITGDNVRVRPMPNTLDSSTPMGSLNTGERVEVISQENGWVRIRLGLPYGGWVRMDRLKGVR